MSQIPEVLERLVRRRCGANERCKVSGVSHLEETIYHILNVQFYS